MDAPARTAPPSLLDRIDLRRVRTAARHGAGPEAIALACLLEGGLLAVDASDPTWSDRDRLVVGQDERLTEAVRAAAARTGTEAALVEVRGGQAMAVAYGLAAASALAGGAFRVWCLLGAGDGADGSLLEVAGVAARGGLATLAVVGTAAADPAPAVLEAAGWTSLRVPTDDPIRFLSAVDHLLAAARPGVIAVGEAEG